jgi:DNA-binding response OmpR family regulator
MANGVDVRTSTPPPGALPPRVLIVDDEVNVRAIIRIMLQHAGFATDEVATAAAALARVQSASVPYDAMLLDYTLPDCAGTDLIPELRRLAPNMRIVLTSGRVEADLPNHGADGYLGKPFTKAQIIAAVRAALAAIPK